MTPKERRNHEIISGTRRKRIAAGSGTQVQDVNQLLRQYAQMAKMFKQMGSGGLAQQYDARRPWRHGHGRQTTLRAVEINSLARKYFSAVQ